MKRKSFFITVGMIFALIGILHVVRGILAWTLVVERFVIPVWFSFVAGLLILFLSYWAFKFSKK